MILRGDPVFRLRTGRAILFNQTIERRRRVFEALRVAVQIIQEEVFLLNRAKERNLRLRSVRYFRASVEPDLRPLFVRRVRGLPQAFVPHRRHGFLFGGVERRAGKVTIGDDQIRARVGRLQDAEFARGKFIKRKVGMLFVGEDLTQKERAAARRRARRDQ